MTSYPDYTTVETVLVIVDGREYEAATEVHWSASFDHKAWLSGGYVRERDDYCGHEGVCGDIKDVLDVAANRHISSEEWPKELESAVAREIERLRQ